MKIQQWLFNVAAVAVFLCLAGCDPVMSVRTGNATEIPDHNTRFSILQVNDSYKIEGLENGGIGGFARLRTLRRQLEADGGKPPEKTINNQVEGRIVRVPTS